MKVGRRTSILLLVIPVALAGCRQSDPRQHEWHINLARARNLVRTQANRVKRGDVNSKFASQEEVLAVAGVPDLKLSRDELVTATARRPRCREAIDWTLDLPADSEKVRDRKAYWIYEEERHFLRPMPACFKPGFDASVFIVGDNDRVLGAKAIAQWKLLPSDRASGP